MLFLRRCIGLPLLFGLLIANPVYAVDSDFDGDGLSDLILTQRDSAANTINWSYQSAASNFGSNVSAGSLGTASDGIAPGYWTTASGAEIATLNLNEETQAVTWTVLDVSSQQTSVQFGSEGDILVSGGDYNGNGTYDAVAVSSNGNAQVLPDIFAGGTVLNLTFTKKQISSGLVFPVRRTGTSDEIAALQSKKKKGRYQNSVTFKDLSGNEASLKLPKTKGEIVDAFGLSGGTTDNIVLIERRGKNRRIHVFDLTGTEVFTSTVAAGTFLSGNFTLAGAEQIGIFRSGTFTVLDIGSNGTAEFAGIADLTASDFTNTVSLIGTSGGDIQDACPKGVKKISAGFLWKPVADAADSRFGLPVALFSGSKKFSKKSVQIYAKNGQAICKFTLKVGAPGINCSANHYYSGWIGGCGLSGPQLANKAKKVSGSNKVYVEAANGTCFGPVYPPGRVGGLSC